VRRAAKTDANQREIVAALRGVGASVLPLHRVGQGCPDLLVYYRRFHLLEVKSGPKEPLTDDEAAFIATWKGPVAVVSSVDQALKVVGAV
jgi:hypothetical protein